MRYETVVYFIILYNPKFCPPPYVECAVARDATVDKMRSMCYLLEVRTAKTVQVMRRSEANGGLLGVLAGKDWKSAVFVVLYYVCSQSVIENGICDARLDLNSKTTITLDGPYCSSFGGVVKAV